MLFDLDGTLLPMDQETFTKDYFGRLARYLAPHGVDPERLISSIWRGSAAMVKNDGSMTNEERFWTEMDKVYGEGIRNFEPVFQQFYREEFDKVSASCGHDPAVAPTVRKLKESRSCMGQLPVRGQRRARSRYRARSEDHPRQTDR